MSEVRNEVARFLANIKSDFGGGCTLNKAYALADLIVDNDMKYAVEIGVYKGRSLFPQAIAMKHTGGKVIGIDPYLKESALENDVSDALKDKIKNFVATWDTDETYHTNLNIIRQYNLPCEIIRKKSEEATVPNGIELLHIDGNHDTEFVTKDIELFVPLVKKGGFIVMDDTDWGSVKVCLDMLNKDCELVADHNYYQIWKKLS